MTKKYEPKENSVVIFLNTYKKTSKQPDFTGKLQYEDESHPIAMWKVKEGADLKGKITIGYVKDVSKGDQIDLVLSINEKKTEAKHPDRVGKITIKGVPFSVGVYNQESKKGLKFLSGAIRRTQAESVNEVDEAEKPKFDF